MKRAGFWPVFIVMMLSIDFVAAGVLIYSAVADPSFAVETDYYEKAQAWDATVAERRESAELGWTAEARIVVGLGERQTESQVIVMLRDREFQPLAGASVEIEVFANARAEKRQIVKCAEQLGGVYAAPCEITCDGQWVLNVRAVRGEQTFVDELRMLVGEVE